MVPIAQQRIDIEVVSFIVARGKSRVSRKQES
jgi:hypothetical protein